jgi:hypothetical protein
VAHLFEELSPEMIGSISGMMERYKFLLHISSFLSNILAHGRIW